MKAVLVKLSAVTGTVTNVIVADANRDFPPDKTSILVNVPDDHPVGQGWTWDSQNGFTHVDVAEKLEPIDAAPLKSDIYADTPKNEAPVQPVEPVVLLGVDAAKSR